MIVKKMVLLFLMILCTNKSQAMDSLQNANQDWPKQRQEIFRMNYKMFSGKEPAKSLRNLSYFFAGSAFFSGFVFPPAFIVSMGSLFFAYKWESKITQLKNEKQQLLKNLSK